MEKSKDEIIRCLLEIQKGRINDLEELRGKGVLSDETIDDLINSYKESMEIGNKALGD